MSAPKGNKFAAHDKPWTDALRRVLLQFELKDENGKVQVKAGEALRKIAEITVQAAMAGDKDARKEIAERMDGKPTENVNLNHRLDPAEMSTHELVAAILRERASSPSQRTKQPTELH